MPLKGIYNYDYVLYIVILAGIFTIQKGMAARTAKLCHFTL
jgi:hypothetical protein